MTREVKGRETSSQAPRHPTGGHSGARDERIARRSRHEVLTVAGTFFLLDGVAPRVRRVLLAQVTLQVAIAIVAATLRRYGAFAILAPVFGVGLMAFWGATWGVFPARGAHPRKSGPPAASSS